uniref:Uncharacterized protein n=1 Tax=Anguilla anguilla TaxID=7936 RepID=A0A0E9SS29_ANGAN
MKLIFMKLKKYVCAFLYKGVHYKSITLTITLSNIV